MAGEGGDAAGDVLDDFLFVGVLAFFEDVLDYMGEVVFGGGDNQIFRKNQVFIPKKPTKP